jgi:hypothetical protein
MLEFDKYIYREFIALVQKKNKYKENERMSKTYRRIKYQTTVAVKKLKETKKNIQKEKIREAKKKFKKNKSTKISNTLQRNRRVKERSCIYPIR